MPLATYNDYLVALQQNNTAEFQTPSSGLGFSVTRLGDLSRVFIPAPANPTVSVALDKSSDRAINGFVPNAASGKRMAILGARVSGAITSGAMLMLVDILSISGGLNGTLTTPQTTNLPSAALPRYTSGEGVHAALLIYTSIGTTGTTFTCSYTNQAGTSGQTTPEMAIGTSGQNSAGTLIRLPLQSGDSGFRSIESVTLAATTGTAGNFGVILYRPLAMLMANDVEGASVIDSVSSGRMVGQFAEVLNDACLSSFAIFSTSQGVTASVLLAEV
jgi:hypothetical protein